MLRERERENPTISVTLSHLLLPSDVILCGLYQVSVLALEQIEQKEKEIKACEDEDACDVLIDELEDLNQRVAERKQDALYYDV